MAIHSKDPKPILAGWEKSEYSSYMYREIPGSLSWFHYHCGIRMQRVISFEKSDEGVRRVG